MPALPADLSTLNRAAIRARLRAMSLLRRDALRRERDAAEAA